MDLSIDIAAPVPPQHDSAAEWASAYVYQRIAARSGRRAHQGRRVPPLPCGAISPVLRIFAEERILRVTAGVARALVAWGNGFPVLALDCVPSARTVLALQAAGRRCVTLLTDDHDPSPHADGLAFALHDLCHLDKFIDPEHHLGQVGFFACLSTAMDRPEWAEFEGSFDGELTREWDHVRADMNGSAVFLLAAMKMKLKMAVRRRALRQSALDAPRRGGPLSASESQMYEVALRDLLGLLALEGEVAVAASVISAKHDEPSRARTLLGYFEEIGRSR